MCYGVGMELPIIYEDDDIVVVNKPSGVMTHPDGKTTEATASDWFALHYPNAKEVGETQRLQDGTDIRRPGVVHRLDRDTSGVLVFAKTPEAHTFLKAAFQQHEAKKTYLAFVYGVPKDAKGIISFPIGRSSQDFRLRSAQPGAKGMLRDAVTRWETISDIGTHALLKVMPETGRTHQIRVHLKAIHHPVVGDPLYAPNKKADLGFKRLGLHAYKLVIPLPNGEHKEFVAPLPEDLAKAAEQFPDTASFFAPV